MVFQYENFEIEVSKMPYKRLKDFDYSKYNQVFDFINHSCDSLQNKSYEIRLSKDNNSKIYLVKFYSYEYDFQKIQVFNYRLKIIFIADDDVILIDLESLTSNSFKIDRTKYDYTVIDDYVFAKNLFGYTKYFDFYGNEFNQDRKSIYNSNDLEAVEIHKKLDELNLKLNDITTIDKVREFEKKYNTTLPEDYVWFITNVGDGGGGLDLYPLEHIDKYDEFSYDEEIEKDDDWKMEDLTQDRITAINIMSEGCSYSTGIFIKGEHYGEISKNAEWFAYYDDRIPFKNFKEWYLAWLNEIYLGYSGSNFEYHKLGKIEDILEEYKTTKDISCIWTVMQKCKSISKEVEITLLDLFNSETIIKNKGLIGRVLGHFKFQNMDYIIENMYQSGCYGDLAILLHYKNYSQFRDYSRLLKMLDYLSHNVINDKNCSVSSNSGFMDCLHLIAINSKFNKQDIQEVLNSQNKDIQDAISEINSFYKIKL